MKRLKEKSIRKKKFYMESWIKKGLNIKGDTKRGDIHIQVATLNVNMTFEGEAGGVDLDARVAAKWYFSDFNLKQL